VVVEVEVVVVVDLAAEVAGAASVLV